MTADWFTALNAPKGLRSFGGTLWVADAYRGLLSPELWADARFWPTSLGSALAWKLGAVAVMVAVSAFHDFVAGPRAAREPSGSPAALSARRRAAWLARVNALVGVILVIAAVRLARGG